MEPPGVWGVRATLFARRGCFHVGLYHFSEACDMYGPGVTTSMSCVIRQRFYHSFGMLCWHLYLD
ncbi:MAG TPA: hypothetical protein DEF41_05260 [Desulfovibrio sp.]|uniref:Uncharacterized protein n=1 Tax=Nitratidesulfovibrio vulgaris (strain ATCC 29579 / DSM 644 / CCUG 34227 / NCIMB 8303 / VKM B-1760 / Hildenborough) TaxID=882 RepID=Q72AM0_NITV2|nr:hypothetical protein DVU_1972 [Nitratidesulfovibrio vulgaris str. Hildenborough]HBW15540.1 hypothetical protein [Desulfovibrio sp.]